MKKALFLIPIFFLAVFLPISAFGAEIKTSSELIIGTEEIYEDNTYLAGGNLNVSGQFRQDLFLVGGDVQFDGIVEGDLLVLAGNFNFNGQVLGDLRIVGGESLIQGKVTNDLVVIGGRINLGSESELEGETILAGGEVDQNAELKNESKIIAGKVNFNGKTESPLEITTQGLYLGDNAEINNITYYSPSALEKSSSAKIIGETYYNQISNIKDVSFIKHALLNLITFWVLLKFFTLLLIALALAYIFRVFTQEVTNLSWNSFGKSLLVGIILTLTIPLLVTLLFVSLIGLPIGLMFLFVWIFFSVIAVAISAIMVGALIKKLFKKNDQYEVNFSTVAIGVILITFIGFVPFLGDLTKFIFNIVAFGSISRYLYKLIVK